MAARLTLGQGWCLSGIFEECVHELPALKFCNKLSMYRRFVDGNERLLDLQFIDLFSPDPTRHLEYHLKVM
jgi:hypothetical protein